MYFVSLLLKFSFVFVAQATNQGRIIKQWDRFSPNFGYRYPSYTNTRNRPSEQRIDMESIVDRKEFNNYKHGNEEYDLIVEGNHGDIMYKVSYDDDKTDYGDFNDENDNDYQKYLVNLSDGGDQYVINIENMLRPKILNGKDKQTISKNENKKLSI